MITVYFVQHGIAKSSEVDEARPLSDLGSNQTHKIAVTLKNSQIEIDKICHSGKLRAEQTASIFTKVLGVNETCEIEGLKPNDEPSILIDQIKHDAVLYVGHLPNIQAVVSKILSGGNSSNLVKFENSAIACVEMEENHASLKWFITPSVCP